jgi:VWFA-related protein
MRIYPRKKLLITLLTVTSALLCSPIIFSQRFSQQGCLSDNQVKMIAQVKSSTGVSFNKELRDRLLKIKEKEEKHFQDAIQEESAKAGALKNQMRTSRERNTPKLCSILNEFGWPTLNLVGQDGVDAAFFLLKNTSPFELQRDLLPVIIAATMKGEIARPDFAGYIDRLRLSAGLKQLFGTEATISNGLLVLYPIDGEAEVDRRREQYGLPPLKEYIRTLERLYKLPLVKSPGTMSNKFAGTANEELTRTATTLFEGPEAIEDDVIRFETNLVSLDVSVYSDRQRTHVSSLEQKDFAIFEDGREETVTFFANTEVPFDLVLLIDLSGSTSGKRELIRQTTRRFIEAARPSDRLAIVTFSDIANIISPLTNDRKQLLDSVSKIEGTGGSNVWDALKFTLDEVVGPKTPERRRAVVFMTDGADRALLGFGSAGSRIEFSDLLEAVRQNYTLIIPIYLDTEGHDQLSKRVYGSARRTLAMLAEESGGRYYKARKIEDLSDVYAQVIEDLGKVYSLGYKPTNGKRDDLWRVVTIKVRNRPDLTVRTRQGYYAK